MAQDVFTRLRTSFSSGSGGTLAAVGQEKPDSLTRFFGGNERLNIPYISGYWQLLITPPEIIFTTTQLDSVTWLHTAAEGFTPPSRTLNKADLPGQGGLGSSFVTGQTLNRTFSVTFREYGNLPIFSIFDLWTSIIDPYTGVSPVSGSSWLPATYKGNAFVILTKPTQSLEGQAMAEWDIEQVYYFTGVFPETAPHDSFGSDIATNDFAQHNVSFSFDGWPLTKANSEVVEAAIGALSNATYYDNTYAPYANSVKAVGLGGAGGAGAGPGRGNF